MNYFPVQAEDFNWKDETLEPLIETTAQSNLIEVQKQVIRAALSDKDIYASMPAGRGKNACYVVPIRMELDTARGTTIVISPFRSLIKDRADSVEKRGGISTLCLEAGLDSSLKYQIVKAITEEGNIPAIIYMTPEFIMSSEIVADILDHLYNSSVLKRIVVENADSVCRLVETSTPGQLDLSKFRLNYPKTPIMCLTESPSRRCRANVLKILKLNEAEVEIFSAPVDFPNLSYEVVETDDKIEDMIQRISKDYLGESGIIYCLTRGETEDVAAKLRERGIEADYYHAQRLDREEVQDAWLEGALKVIVATIAFSTFNKKVDVRFVYQHSLPMSFEAYYREAGKAGYDNEPASSILYYSESDKERLRYLIQSGTLDPGEDTDYREVERDVPDSLNNRPETMAKDPKQKTQKDTLIRFELSRLIQMIRYANDQVKCRREMILNYFGQEFNRKLCSNQCDNCRRINTVSSHKGQLVWQIDVSRYASYALRLIDDCTQLERRITKEEAVQCLAGFNDVVLRRKRLLELKSYGMMRKKSIKTIERILTALETRYIIGANPIKQLEGSDYLHLRILSPSLANAVHEGRLKIMLPAFQVFNRKYIQDEIFDVVEIDAATADAAESFVELRESSICSYGMPDNSSNSSSSPILVPQPSPSILETFIGPPSTFEEVAGETISSPPRQESSPSPLTRTTIPATHLKTSPSDSKRKRRKQ